MPVSSIAQASAGSATDRILAIVAVVLVALIIGAVTGVLERVDAAPLGTAILRGGTAFGVVAALASVHATLGAPALLCLVNALFGVLGGLAGLVLMRIDGRPWARAVINGGACFGGAVGVALAVESLAGLL